MFQNFLKAFFLSMFVACSPVFAKGPVVSGVFEGSISVQGQQSTLRMELISVLIGSTTMRIRSCEFRYENQIVSCAPRGYRPEMIDANAPEFMCHGKREECRYDARLVPSKVDFQPESPFPYSVEYLAFMPKGNLEDLLTLHTGARSDAESIKVNIKGRTFLLQRINAR
jgi:hypothetical protein